MSLVTLARYFRYLRHRKGIGLGLVFSVLGFSVIGNSICYWFFDGNEDLTFADALWYSVISITTIGYGDHYAQHPAARLGTFLFVIVLGLGAFSVLLGMAIDFITDFSLRERTGMGSILTRDHILIVNFPAANRVAQLVDELRSDPQHPNREIVIISDDIDTLPFEREHLLFVRGPVLEPETYLRAKISDAKLAIVLATSYADSNSDAVVASAAAVIDNQNPNVYIVAECLNAKHRMLFDTVNCNAIVPSLTISGNLLVQEANDPGVSQMVNVITSNVRGATLFSTEVTQSDEQTTYKELAVTLLERDVNLICVNRRDESLISFRTLHPQIGDRAIYAGRQRFSWDDLLKTAKG